jgi:hypothetical protein
LSPRTIAVLSGDGGDALIVTLKGPLVSKKSSKAPEAGVFVVISFSSFLALFGSGVMVVLHVEQLLLLLIFILSFLSAYVLLAVSK